LRSIKDSLLYLLYLITASLLDVLIVIYRDVLLFSERRFIDVNHEVVQQVVK
jgi:hypothetical protein